MDTKTVRRDLAAAFVLAEKMGFSEGICNHFSMDVGGDRFLADRDG